MVAPVDDVKYTVLAVVETAGLPYLNQIGVICITMLNVKKSTIMLVPALNESEQYVLWAIKYGYAAHRI
jgi:hypothetical protein